VACRAAVYGAQVLTSRIEYLEKSVREQSALVAGLTQLLQKSTKKSRTLPQKLDPLTAP
jgi:hypothetical protein